MRTAMTFSTSLARAAFRRPAPALPLRQLHRSAPRLASEIPRDPFTDDKLRALQDKLGQNPAAMESIKNLGQLMMSKGASMATLPYLGGRRGTPVRRMG